MSPPGNELYWKQKGFSLVEILVVLVLFGLAAALIMPSFSGAFKSLETETAARDLVTRMKQCRSEAIARQEVQRIKLQPATSDEVGRYVLTNAYEEEIESFDLPRDVSIVLPENQELMTVSFYPNGRASGGGFALLSSQGKRLRIEVDTVTGFARVRRAQEEAGR
jgi:type II secretion system protein H